MSSITYKTLYAEDFLAYQLNGPLALTLLSSMLTFLQKKDSTILSIVNRTIDSAVNGQLDDYGLILGAPRPLYSGNTWFRFDAVSNYPDDSTTEGLGKVSDPEMGGMLWSTSEIPDVVINKLGDELYRRYLKACIVLRHSQSITSLLSVLEAANLVLDTYPLIAFDAYHDIEVAVAPSVEDSYVDLLQGLYNKYYNTSPTVRVVKAV